jgi:hypothetical protein
MVVFRVDSKLRALLQDGKRLSDIVSHDDGVETVSHVSIFKSIQASDTDSSLASLVHGVELHATHREAALAHTREKPRNPELAARLARIRIENENREYERMVKDVVRASSTNAEAETERLGRMGAQMSIGANVIITMITCFVAGYFVFKHSSGREAVGLTGGIASMIVAMCVEAILVMTRMYTIHDAAEKQRGRRPALRGVSI